MQDNEVADTGAKILNDYIKGDKGLAKALKKCARTIARWRALGEGPKVTRVAKSVRRRAGVAARPAQAWGSVTDGLTKQERRGSRPRRSQSFTLSTAAKLK